MWTALYEGLYEGFSGGDDYKARCNRLALLLMTRAALTVREIIGLTFDCAQPFTDSAGPALLSSLHPERWQSRRRV